MLLDGNPPRLAPPARRQFTERTRHKNRIGIIKSNFAGPHSASFSRIGIRVQVAKLVACFNKANLGFSRSGKLTDNAFIEAFNGRLRAECLNAHWFMTLADAREKLEGWRRDYNEVRPHGAIGNKVPMSLLNPAGDTSPSVATKAENSSFE